ncbi:MAG: hypothetical protein ACPG1C_09450 [Alphaproteobacteria bacterium]
MDGDRRKHQQSLTAALKQLEAEAKISNGPGRIEANGPLARKLKQLLPPQYQSLSAIQGTACLILKDRLGQLAAPLSQFQFNNSARDLEIKTRQPVHVKEVAQSSGQAPRIATQSLSRPFLKGAVGRAANAKEDVALVQAAIRATRAIHFSEKFVTFMRQQVLLSLSGQRQMVVSCHTFPRCKPSARRKFVGTKQQTNTTIDILKSCDLDVSGDIDFFDMLGAEAPAALNFASSRLGNKDDNIAVAECNARRRLKQFELGGLKQAAINLRHYLDGSGKDLTIPAAEYRAIPKIKEMEQELMRRWERAVTDARPHPQEQGFRTFIPIIEAWREGISETKTGRDNFFFQISRSDGIAISKDFSFSWGQSNFQALAAEGLVANLNGNHIAVNGIITFLSMDPYDFQLGLPGSFDGKLLEQAGIAKEFWMIAKWEREFQATYEMRPAAARFWQPLDQLAAKPETVAFDWGAPMLDGALASSQDVRKSIAR